MRNKSGMFGAAFYPEQQPREDWERYIRQMRESGISFVRMGEFAWELLEPCEGEFDFSWLDTAMDMLGEHGIGTMLCTPGASPPLEVALTCDIFPVCQDGSTLTAGQRRHVCPNSPDYRRRIEQLVQAMARHYAGNPNLKGYQIDNEFGHPICYCQRCLALFQEFCRGKFGNVERFNTELNMHFWSQGIREFSDLRFPLQLSHPGIRLLYRRFFSESVLECFSRQAAIVRRESPGVPVTTNSMITWHGYDHEKMNRIFDYAAGDWYFDCDLFGEGLHGTVFATAFLRGFKGGVAPRFQEFRGSASRPGEVRFHTLAAIASGAVHISYFRWDPCMNGQERNEYAIAAYPENPGRGMDDLRAVIREAEEWDLGGAAAVVPSQTALLYSFDAHMAWSERTGGACGLQGDFGNGYARMIAEHMRALTEMGERADIVFPGGDFSRYRLIIAPALLITDVELEDKIRTFVNGGGIFLMLPYSALFDGNGSCFRNGIPGRLSDVFGITVADSPPPWPGRFLSWPGKGEFRAKLRVDEIQAEDAIVVARFDNGVAGLTRCGTAWYCGTFPEELAEFYRVFYAENDLRTPEEAATGGEYYFRRGELEFCFRPETLEVSIRRH